MLTRDDLVDIILEHLAQERHALAGDPRSGPFPRGSKDASRPEAGRPRQSARGPARRPEAPSRLFLSEYDVKRRLTPSTQELKIPKDAILSPLALDWLVLRGISIVRE